MLDFYGFELKNRYAGPIPSLLPFMALVPGRTTGEVAPLADAARRADRFHNLSCYGHNSLRITRISKCLGLHGFQHFQVACSRYHREWYAHAHCARHP